MLSSIDLAVVGWIAACAVFVVVEALTTGLASIWFALGAAAAFLVSFVAVSTVWLQTGVFVLVSLFSMVLIRPLARKYLTPKKEATNADRVIGQSAVVTQAIDNVEGKGMVKIAGQIWSARSEHDAPIPEGAEVKVLRIEGVKVFVELV